MQTQVYHSLDDYFCNPVWQNLIKSLHRPDSTVAPANRGGMRNGMTQAWAASLGSQMGDAEKTSSQQSERTLVGSSLLSWSLTISERLWTLWRISRPYRSDISPPEWQRLIHACFFLADIRKGVVLKSIWSQVTEVPQVHGIRISMAMILSQLRCDPGLSMTVMPSSKAQKGPYRPSVNPICNILKQNQVGWGTRLNMCKLCCWRENDHEAEEPATSCTPSNIHCEAT